jgi:ring-1,2-phenylacetyl-CoA epoxidase subunit PaaC
VRHFLYDTALAIKFDMLTKSSFEPLAELSSKIRGEVRYHTLHANTWIKQLGTATEESISRLQKSLELALPHALGMFEQSPYEKEIIASGLFPGEKAVKELWVEKISEVLKQTNLQLPDLKTIKSIEGGRIGKHSEHLQPLLDEMSEVFRIDPGAEW